MSDITVKQFAESINTPAERLVEQLNEAGIKVKSSDDAITEDQKAKLLEHLNASTSGPKKITLSRKKTTEIKVAKGGQARTVAVETRKTKTYIKRDELPVNIEDNTSSASLAADVVLPAETIDSVVVEVKPKDKKAIKEPVIAVKSDAETITISASDSVSDSASDVVKITETKVVEEPAIEASIESTEGKSITVKKNVPAAIEPIMSSDETVKKEKADLDIERARQQEAILAARLRANEEAQQKQNEEDRRRLASERKQADEMQKISDAARAASLGNTVSKVAISFKSDEPEIVAAKEARPARSPQNDRNSSDRPARPAAGTRPARSVGDRPVRSAGDRSAGERPARPTGDRPVRPAGDRPVRPAGDRPARPSNERTANTANTAIRPALPRSGVSSDVPTGEVVRSRHGKLPAKNLDSLRQDGRNKDGSAKKKGRESEKFIRFGGDDEISNHRRGGKRKKHPQQEHGFNMPTAVQLVEVQLPETISVADLAHKMHLKGTEVIKALMKLGSMVTINQVLDQETAAIVVEELGHTYKMVSENALEDELNMAVYDGKAITRPPVVTIMGHVDHGKTSTLDYIRRTHVATGEAGGITQHIGAYHVQTNKGAMTFLDTPGHSAFTAMRARGAKVTDIVVLVVAVDDGVMPQTVEAIQHAKAANVPLVIAVNKIDKPNSDRERILAELSQHGVVSEEWGGENIFCYISAKTGEGMDNLLDQILVQSEVLELTAISDGPAKGAVIESRLDKGRGPVATILIQSGKLKKGDIVLAGIEYGRVRAMVNERGEQIEEAGPSIPVEVLGLSGIPAAGDDMIVVQDERKAREIALFRQGKFREVKLARLHTTKLENIFTNMAEGKITTVNVVLKADVQGSIEAISNALTELSNDEVRVKIVSTGVGGITETDANLAVASSAIVIGFNVRADSAARRIIEEDGLDLHYYSIIYEVVDEIKRALEGKLAPEFKEQIIGIAEVRDVFRSPKIGAIAGCMVTEGMIKRRAPIRVLRENIVIYEGELESLRRFKDDVAEVRSGYECGIGVKNYNDVKVGDQIEVYECVQVARTL